MNSAQKPQAVCGQEALDLLNCVTQNPYDQDRCLQLLQSLRQCVLDKKVKKFSLAEADERKPITSGEKQH